MEKIKEKYYKDRAKGILEFKMRCRESNIDTSNVLYCPEVPITGINKSYVIEEFLGIKVARLVTASDE